MTVGLRDAPRITVAFVCYFSVGWAMAALPPLPVPAENPITEPKRVLGKILYWDEQLSSNDTVACGTCHVLSLAGTDPRFARNPGWDGVFHTIDDVFGSLGIARADANNDPYEDPVYGWDPQVTGRSAPPVVGSQYAPELFWDGRAASTFYDPETGQLSIASGGALENQATGPIRSDVEMARESRSWSMITAKLADVAPLQLGTNWPPDVAAAIAADGTYPELFASAFGDDAITAERIAFAIATYERTLFPDQTPWDRYVDGQTDALSASQITGWEFFQNSECQECHTPPLFTNHGYRNIGLRPVQEDTGRQQVTGLHGDRGKFKVPTLRNVSLKKRFMHHGQITRLQDVIAYYMGEYTEQFSDNLDPLIPGIEIPLPFIAPLTDFLANGLTDPRVAAETFPFDRPTLRTERMAEFPVFFECLSGPESTPDPAPPTTSDECIDLFDVNNDGDVDLRDFPSLTWVFTAS